MNKNLDIEYGRCLLLILVLFCHTDLSGIRSFDSMEDGWHLYYIVSGFLSRIIGQCAVPCFFMISGFLFFRNIETFDKNTYINKLKSRFHSLVIPFFSWNLLFIFLVYVRRYIFISVGLDPYDDAYDKICSSSVFELFWSDPIDHPLWYVRELIYMTLLSPIIYYGIKCKKKILFFIVSALFVIVNVSPTAGFTKALFFYSIGAYFSMKNKSLFDFSNSTFIISGIGVIVLAICMFCFTDLLIYLNKLNFIVGGVFLLCCIKRLTPMMSRIGKTLLYIASCSFFIYAAHMVYVLLWTKGLLARTPWSDTCLGATLNYLLSPFICIAFSLSAYWLIEKIFPQLIATLNGKKLSIGSFKFTNGI